MRSLTAFVIVLEITGKSVMPVPLILTAVIATAVSRLFNPVSLYHALAENFVAQTRAFLPKADEHTAVSA